MREETVAVHPHLWTREGFNGPVSVVARRGYAPDYLSVEGPHAPRRAVLERLVPRDKTDADALPTVVATSRCGVSLLTSARTKAMSFTLRNVAADELHFIQSGTVRFDTDVGSLVADEGDFVCIPRAVAYRYWILRMSPADAAERGVRTGDLVRVHNDQASVICAVDVSSLVMGGVVRGNESCAELDLLDSPLGLVDRGGCLNLLTPGGRMSKTADGILPNSCWVEVEKWTAAALKEAA